MSYIDEYQKSHTHPVNRALHTFGIPCVVVSSILLLWDFLFCDLRQWPWFLGLFIFGWVLQFIGHAFEGKKPAFFSNPIYLLVGPLWWLLKILGLKKSESNTVEFKNDDEVDRQKDS